MHTPSAQLGRRRRSDPGLPCRLAHQQVQVPPLPVLQHYAGVVLVRLPQSGHLVRLYVAEKSLHGLPVFGADHHVRFAEVHLSQSLLRWISRGSNLQHVRNLGEEPVQLPPRRVARPHL
ncbi:MAG: hypothetical protein ACK559_41640, partial [bacterium]